MRTQYDVNLAGHEPLDTNNPVVLGLLRGFHSCSRSSVM
ncbi:hypothetical protein ALQ08_104027 [Pseudomonas syringae pv. delphinii]|uniref:Uncharacterized protein n=1 Tax=Pseudomonas syringae pv. delphinii TaxID=192088 RepID=A0A0P9QA81_9PSED|nr:hypothetical protein ALO72_103301 [Pseudomonas syringae pv. delphinii]RMP20260.1 hypothetical protein ALQ27_104099 [Pseudomonas syringae pv. delphinii]RMQ18167.1 hypothetical protein ALQ08_104027 [Pseudomonas syringae pv. delphinii]